MPSITWSGSETSGGTRWIVAVTCTVPTFAAAGQPASERRVALVHTAAFCGLPSSPGASRTNVSLMSSSADDSVTCWKIVTSGCEPACVLAGVTVNWSRVAAPSAEAGASRHSRARSASALAHATDWLAQSRYRRA